MRKMQFDVVFLHALLDNKQNNLLNICIFLEVLIQNIHTIFGKNKLINT